MAKVNNKWSITDVRKIVEEVANNKDEFGFLNDLEIAYNGRLSRTLARCLSRTKLVYGKVEWTRPFKLEFGKTILNVDSYETLKQVVLHETAHAIANVRHQDNCNHDARFKLVCEEIGCKMDGASSATASNQAREEIKDVSLQMNKHKITCVGCGSEFFYRRATDVVKQVQMGRRSCICPKCKHDEFTYTQLR